MTDFITVFKMYLATAPMKEISEIQNLVNSTLSHDGIAEKVRQEYKANGKLKAVKLYKDATGLSLQTCVDHVNEIMGTRGNCSNV